MASVVLEWTLNLPMIVSVISSIIVVSLTCIAYCNCQRHMPLLNNGNPLRAAVGPNQAV